MEVQKIPHKAPSEAPDTSTLPRNAVIITNPTSGSYARFAHDLEETVKFLQQAEWQVELKLTQAAGDGSRLAREAVEQKADIVIAAGGDGTINEIIQELAGSETALGVLPIGTVNVWAREMVIPLESAGARDVLLHGVTRQIDLGRINDRYFLLMVGVGFDGEVAQSVEKNHSKRFGVLGYVFTMLGMSIRFRGFRVVLTIDGQEMRTRAFQIVIGNTQLYGGAVTFTWQAKCDDGLLDVCIVRTGSRWRFMLMLRDLILQRKRNRELITYKTCTSLEIRSRRPIALQIDGDAAGQTPASIQIVPGALKVIVPQQGPGGIFQEGSSTEEVK
ncbi:MAG TPA: diacylglycerol kinase family protein [Ktedonobacteraceae bacterium]